MPVRPKSWSIRTAVGSTRYIRTRIARCASGTKRRRSTVSSANTCPSACRTERMSNSRCWPPAAEQPVTEGPRSHRVVQVTDLHLLPEPDARLLGIDTLATFEAALAAAFAAGTADLVVVTGDIAHVPETSTYVR